MFIKNLISENIFNILKQSDSSGGNIDINMASFSFFIPAGWGTVVTLISNVSIEMLFLFDENRIESDFYTPINFVGVKNGFQNELKYSSTRIDFVQPIDLKMTNFSSIPEAISYLIVNPSGTDMTGTITISTLVLKRSFFDDWYRRVFKYYYNQLGKVVNLNY